MSKKKKHKRPIGFPVPKAKKKQSPCASQSLTHWECYECGRINPAWVYTCSCWSSTGGDDE